MVCAPHTYKLFYVLSFLFISSATFFYVKTQCSLAIDFPSIHVSGRRQDTWNNMFLYD